MNVWYLIFLCGFLTFLIRFIPMSGFINFQGSDIIYKSDKFNTNSRINSNHCSSSDF